VFPRSCSFYFAKPGRKARRQELCGHLQLLCVCDRPSPLPKLRVLVHDQARREENRTKRMLTAQEQPLHRPVGVQLSGRHSDFLLLPGHSQYVQVLDPALYREYLRVFERILRRRWNHQGSSAVEQD
jgi:hypothetical protein